MTRKRHQGQGDSLEQSKQKSQLRRNSNSDWAAQRIGVGRQVGDREEGGTEGGQTPLQASLHSTAVGRERAPQKSWPYLEQKTCAAGR